MKDNIVLLCKYYKPKDKYKSSQEKEIAKREFLSCTASYNYVSYVDTGSIDNTPTDYTKYVGNNEKSCGVFSKDGLLTDGQKRELREQLSNTQSCIWDMVISFREEFGEMYCRDYEQAYNFIKKELPKFFTRAGLDKDNIIWYAGLHENTENKHIHISFFEKEPKFYKNNNELVFHYGKIPKNILITSKVIFEKALTNKTAEIVKTRKDLTDKYEMFSDAVTLKKGLKKQLLNLYNMMPKSGRISYDSENMESVKSYVDDITRNLITSNKNLQKSFSSFLYELCKLDKWQKENYKHIPDEYNVEIYKQDIMRRLGNKTIQTALEIGHIRDKIESITTYTKRDRYYKKRQRKRQWQYLFDCLEYYHNQEISEMENFKQFYNKLERYRKQKEYEM